MPDPQDRSRSRLPVILDAQGHPIRTPPAHETVRSVQLRGGILPNDLAADLNPGWREGLPSDDLSFSQASRYGVSRAGARRICRTLFHTNGLFRAATEISGAFIVGDDLRYGTVADKGLQTLIDEFWMANNFQELFSQRVVNEWFLDGESAFVFPTEQGGVKPDPNAPALIGLMDVDLDGFSVHANTAYGALPADMVDQLRLSQFARADQVWNRGEFVWAANGAMHNEPRGWPISHAIAEAAVAYIAMLNMRLNVHYVQQRILAVYKALFDPNAPGPGGVLDGGVSAWQRKTAGFRHLPRDGGVLPVMVQPGRTNTATGEKVDGFEESIEFLSPAQGAADAATDMRLLLRYIGLCIGGLPEHYLGEGGNATRTTAASMGLPAVRLARARQAALRGHLDRLFRAEIRRRAGPDAAFRLTKGSRKKTPLARIELPWEFPSIREESFEDIVRRVEIALTHNLISEQTATADLGYDHALETERRGSTPTPPPPDAPPPDPGSP